MDSSNIPRNIRKFLREKKLRQVDIVEHADIHPTHVSRIVNGIQNPNLETVIKIAKVLNVTVDDLLITRA